MTAQANHHFVPAFLLREWESDEDGKLTAMRWINGEVSERRFKAKSVAKERHLYAVRKSQPEPDQQLEREYMTKRVDERAAQAHKALCGMARGGTVTEDQQYAWTLFLVSLAYRVPGAVEYVRIRGVDALVSEFGKTSLGEAASLGVPNGATLKQYVEAAEPELLHDFGNRSMPHLIETSSLNKMLFESTWAVRDFGKVGQGLLIGDRPLTLLGRTDGNFMFYLPLTPTLGFFAYNSDAAARPIIQTPLPKLLRALNRQMVEQASVYVYGVNGEHMAMIPKRLERTPAGPGLGFGPRPPAVR